jgi:hypothetical protein
MKCSGNCNVDGRFEADARSIQSPVENASAGVYSRAYKNFPAVNWVWAASNANHGCMIVHLPNFERI